MRGMSDSGVFDLDRFIARRKFFKVFGGTFTIHAPDGMGLRAYVRQNAFKLKETSPSSRTSRCGTSSS